MMRDFSSRSNPRGRPLRWLTGSGATYRVRPEPAAARLAFTQGQCSPAVDAARAFARAARFRSTERKV